MKQELATGPTEAPRQIEGQAPAADIADTTAEPQVAPRQRGGPVVIVRIMGEGQFEVDDAGSGRAQHARRRR